MGMTLAEKILSDKCGKTLRAGDYVLVDVDRMYLNEGSGLRAVAKCEEITGAGLAKPEGSYVFLDHCALSPQRSLSNVQKDLRRFAERVGCKLFDVNAGVSHQIIADDLINPCDVIVGGDSHTCTGGALGAFAAGMGSTDMGSFLPLAGHGSRYPRL